MESLEPRQLLAADLTLSYASQPPASLLPGGKNKVVLLVTNTGDAVAKGSVAFSLSASTDATLSVNDTSIATLTKNVNLKAGKATKITLTFTSPIGIADGSYFVIADEQPAAAIGDTNTANDAVASASAIAIKKAFVDLSATISSAPASLALGAAKPKATKMSVVVTNNGNVKESGAVGISVFASDTGTVGSASQLLFTLGAKNQSLAAGKSKTFTINGKFAATVSSGTYDLVTRLDIAAALGDTVAANNIATTAPIVITNSAVPAAAKTPGTLTASSTTLASGFNQTVTFTVPVSSPDTATSVVVDEVDSSGNILSQVAVLADNGAAATGDVTAADGVFSGRATINPATAGDHLYVALVTANGTTVRSAPTTITASAAADTVVGAFEFADSGTVSGWAYDPASPNTPLDIIINLDGQDSTTLTANLARPDLTQLPNPDHGFSGTTPSNFSGTHTIEAIALNPTTQARTILGTLTFTNAAPTGVIQSATTSSITGYAYDPDVPTASLNIIICVDVNTNIVQNGVANIDQPALVATIGSANHGFDLTIPPQSAGAHTILVFAADAETGITTLIGSSTVTFS